MTIKLSHNANEKNSYYSVVSKPNVYGNRLQLIVDNSNKTFCTDIASSTSLKYDRACFENKIYKNRTRKQIKEELTRLLETGYTEMNANDFADIFQARRNLVYSLTMGIQGYDLTTDLWYNKSLIKMIETRYTDIDIFDHLIEQTDPHLKLFL